MHHRRVLTATLLLLIACAGTASAQRGRDRRAPAQSSTAVRSEKTSDKGINGYWAAQRSIEAAIQQLEAYLRESPDGERSATARQQLQMLRGISLTATLPEWARMNSLPLRHVPRWRVSALESQPERTRVTVEINCERDDGGDCYFDPFGSHPLVLLDDVGRFYPMLEAATLPSTVRVGADGQAVLSGGRTIQLLVDFTPLSVSVASGQIYYRDSNRAQPAKFFTHRRK